jgi:hypothetical protein
MCLEAVSQLSRVVLFSRGRCSQEEFERIKKAVGLAVGQIQAEILDAIYSRYPELDDLK